MPHAGRRAKLRGPAGYCCQRFPRDTAGGTSALQKNTTGNASTAFGAAALQNNTTGIENTAFGNGALLSNITGTENTAVGLGALSSNTSGTFNTAVGWESLLDNNGGGNVAIGSNALASNTTASENTAVGFAALARNTSGAPNTALGFEALVSNTTGSNNTAIGSSAGAQLTSGDNNIYLAAASPASESNTMRLGQVQTRTFIAGISGVAVTGASVEVTSTGQLGIMPSSARFKHDIRDLAEGSSGLLKLRPVSFRYNNDPADTLQYGLVAEEVAKIYPELVTYGADGQVLTVRYQVLSAMLLNELQKQAKEIEAQRAAFEERVAKLERTIDVHNGN